MNYKLFAYLTVFVDRPRELIKFQHRWCHQEKHAFENFKFTKILMRYYMSNRIFQIEIFPVIFFLKYILFILRRFEQIITVSFSEKMVFSPFEISPSPDFFLANSISDGVIKIKIF